MPEPTTEAAAPDFTPELVTAESVLGQHELILLYGEVGTGKTHTAGTAPEPQWWLTPGGKNEIKTVFGKNFIEQHGKKERYITSVMEGRFKGQMVDNPPGYDYCCDALDTFLEWNYAKGVGVQSIIVDNSTVLEEYMMNKAIYAEYMLADNKAKTTLTRERSFGIRKPGDNTYGGAQSFMDRYVSWLKELPFHLIFVAHTREEWESVDGNERKKVLKRVLPEFVGKQRTNIPNRFDNVWRADVSGGGRSISYNIQTVKDAVRMAKTRVGGILEEYEGNPDLGKIITQFSQYAKTQQEE